jgi:hypothetical protein
MFVWTNRRLLTARRSISKLGYTSVISSSVASSQRLARDFFQSVITISLILVDIWPVNDDPSIAVEVGLDKGSATREPAIYVRRT